MKLFFALFIISTSALAEIPHSLIKLREIKDKDGEAYMFLAHQAAMDARYSAESALEGENSSLALKILGVGLDLMPHRDDLKNLRNTALKTYLKITQKLEEDSKKNCSILKERYDFLATVAPDAFVKLKYDTSCGELIKSTPEKVAEPTLIKNLESEFKATLSHDWKNSKFPYEDVLNNSFMLTRSLYGENFGVECKNFKIDTKSKEVESLDVHTDCTLSGIASEFRETSFKYYGFLDHLLIVPNGTKAVMYSTLDGTTKFFKTSESLYRIYERAFDNESFDEDMSTFALMTMTLKYKNKAHAENILVKLNHKNFKSTGVPDIQYEKGPKERFESLATKTTLFLSSEEMKELEEVRFTIDYKSTYELYKKNFEDAIKSDLDCQEMASKLSVMEESRKKRRMKKSYDSACPPKGLLGSLIRQL
jgi:hypothetical protein